MNKVGAASDDRLDMRMRWKWLPLFVLLTPLAYLIIVHWLLASVLDKSGANDVFTHFRWTYLKSFSFYVFLAVFGTLQTALSLLVYAIGVLGEELKISWAAHRGKARPRVFQEPGTCCKRELHKKDGKAEFVVVENGMSKPFCREHLADYLQTNPRALADAVTQMLSSQCGPRRSGQLWPR